MSTTTTTQDIPLPVVHLNGSGKSNLIQDYSEARTAVDTAIDKLSRIFHMRDYYPLGDNHGRVARMRRDEQLQSLQSVLDYIDLHLAHIHDHGR